MTGTLRIEANLSLEHDGTVIDVWDQDDRLVANAPSFRAARRLRDTLARIPGGPIGGAERLDEITVHVDVRVRHATVAQVGAGVDGGRLDARLLGSAGAVNWRGVLTAALRRLG